MDNDHTLLGVVIAATNEHEVRHIERLLDAAADSDPLRDWLETQHGVHASGRRFSHVKTDRLDRVEFPPFATKKITPKVSRQPERPEISEIIDDYFRQSPSDN